ncbi:hypothetical protein ND748_26895, partial [Frankia sp. AiPs1]|uniref:hypothetical protein n=1 Tax=Frankia sp. AiPs1 TaxID=573493 RepID=UPI0020445FD4
MPMTAGAKIATLLAAQTESAPLEPPVGWVASRSWTVTGTVNPAASTTYRVSATVATIPDVDPADGPDGAQNAETAVATADLTLSYQQLVRFRDALSADGYTVTEVFEGWRTVALDVTPAAAPAAPTARGRKAAAEPVAPL